MDDKKIAMNERQWRLFEYNMSRWMVENKYILDNEEKKKFYKCANLSLGMGLLNGSLVYFLCKKYKSYFTPFARNFLTFSFGVYSSVIVNKIYRRKAYTEILTSKTSMTDKARQVMNEILNQNTNNMAPIQQLDKTTTKDTSDYDFKDNYGFMNNDQFLQTHQEPKIEETQNKSLVQDRNTNVSNEQTSEMEKQSLNFLNDSDEGKYVSWDDIRRRNE